MSEVMSSQLLHSQPWSEQIGSASQSSQPLVPEQEAYREDSPMVDRPPDEQQATDLVDRTDNDQEMSETGPQTVPVESEQPNADHDNDEVMSPAPQEDGPEQQQPQSSENEPSQQTEQNQTQTAETDEPMPPIPEQNAEANESADAVPPPPPPPPAPAESEVHEPPKEPSPWMDIPEINAELTEDELKWIADNPPRNAHDDSYWHSRAFTNRDDPELTPGTAAKIEWTVEKYNGTQEDPNRDLIMFSPSVELEGHSWRLKLYPKGNKTSSYMSVYLECETFDSGNEKSKLAREAPELLDTPIPTTGEVLKKPQRLAVEFLILVYNPQEPGVMYQRHSSNGYSKSSPDHGFGRFGGLTIPELGTRLHNQKAAMLSKDRLGFICHLRIIQDPTNALFCNNCDVSRAECFQNTGLNEITGGHVQGNGRGQLAAALATWALLPPFRRIINSVPRCKPSEDPEQRSKPLVEALQSVLRKLRTPAESSVKLPSLQKISLALDMQCTYIPEHADIHRTWNILSDVLVKELAGTSQCEDLVNLLSLNGSGLMPETFKWDTQSKGFQSKRLKFSVESQDLEGNRQQPGILCTVDVPRRSFKGREWVVRSEDVKPQESFTVNHTSYQLYAVITHGKVDSSDMFSAYVRPDGKKWYKFGCLPDRNFFPSRLTKLQAVTSFKSSASSLLYIRADVAENHLNIDSKTFIGAPEKDPAVPDHFSADTSEAATAVSISPDNPPETTTNADQSKDVSSEKEAQETGKEEIETVRPAEHVDITVFTPDCFWSVSDTPGTMDTFQHKRARLEGVGHILKTGSIYDIRMDYDCTLEDVQSALMAEFPSVKHKHQLSLKPLDAFSFHSPVGSWATLPGVPDLPSPSSKRYFESLSKKYFGNRLLLDILDEQDVPPVEAPVPEPSATIDGDVTMSDADSVVPTTSTSTNAQAENDSNTSQSSGSQPSENNSQSDGSTDTSMTNTEDPAQSSAPAESKKPPTHMYMFLKLFLPKQQKLVNICGSSCKVKKSVAEAATEAFQKESQGQKRLEQQGLDKTVFDVSTTKFKLVKECGTDLSHQIRSSDTFENIDFCDGDIVVMIPNLSTSERHEIEVQGGLPDFADFIRYLYDRANHPRLMAVQQTHAYLGEDYHQGSFSRGKYHGLGKHIYGTGDVYEGAFVMGQREGKGKLTHSNGDVYEGDWAADKMHGEGVLTESATGNAYTGGFRDGRKFGAGVTRWQHAEDATKLCAICYEQEIDCAFYDCGHVCACAECAAQLENCPVCRKSIIKAMKIYFRSYI